MKRILSIGLLLATLIGFAGGEVGNGARAVWIAPRNGAPYADLTDLWEAQHPFFDRSFSENQNRFERLEFKGAELPSTDFSKGLATVLDQNSLFFDRLHLFIRRIENLTFDGRSKGEISGSAFVGQITHELKKLARFKITTPSEPCPTITDVTSIYLPALHPVFQAISTNTVKQSMCISKKFTDNVRSPIMIPAAIFHELIYLVGNAYGQNHSDLTRAVVATVYSNGFEDPKIVTDLQLTELMNYFVQNEPFFSPKHLKEILAEILPTISKVKKMESEVASLVMNGSPRDPDSVLLQFQTSGKLKDETINYEYAYATESFQKNNKNNLKLINMNYYSSCTAGFEVERRTYQDVTLGEVVQFFVVPPIPSVQFSPGRQWFPRGDDLSYKDYKTMAQSGLRMVGPVPYANVTLTSTKGHGEKSEIAEWVLISKNRKQLIWSFGGYPGRCD